MSQLLRILHVTESMASGTMEVIADLSGAQSRDGHSVYVAHTVRPETPSEEFLDRRFDRAVVRTRLLPLSMSSPIGTFRAFLELRRIIRTWRPDILHLHSSKAGALGRVVCLSLREAPRVFYSPHGFSFLRQDVAPWVRWFFLAAERLLSRMCGTIVACSGSELQVARQARLSRRMALVENSIAVEGLPVADHVRKVRPVVVSSGRLCYQKAPWRFFSLARSLEHLDADFIWIGDGQADFRGQYEPLPGNVRVTGWIARDEVIRILSESDVYVLLSLWEGMPLVLIEAQAIGLPAVVTDSVGSRDVVLDGETGYICTSEDEWIRRVTSLISDEILRARLGSAAASRARDRYNVPRMYRDIMRVYVQDA